MSIETVAVVGGGFMGSGIAQVCAQAGHTVRLIDLDSAQLTKAQKSIAWSVTKFVEKKRVEGTVDEILGRVSFGASLDGVTGADMVIEAVYEDAKVKKDVWSTLDGLCDAGAILGSNTSTIPITLLASATARPERFVGIHFFGPVPMMRLVEVIRGQKTSDQTMTTTVEFARGLGKSPIVVNKDVPGFLMNRIFGAMGCEAIRLVEAGVGRVEDIDQGMVDGFNLKMGPLSIADLSGLDIAYNAFRVMHELDPERMPAPPKLLERLAKEGKLGVKTGEGFYKYDADGKKLGPAF